MGNYQIVWPSDFDRIEWLLESKGVLFDIEVKVGDHTIMATFYDPVRLSQDIEEEIQSSGFFSETFIIVLERLTKRNIEATLDKMYRSGLLESMAKAQFDR
ncbi:hypothetical protein [Pelagibius sp.]|uniref:hypothetical protein n=1 Tax=Pelagibius sp. TaxID=1931238 RepID=UPI0026034C5A|nr:hypothetical protein [Pelagibius sp.]